MHKSKVKSLKLTRTAITATTAWLMALAAPSANAQAFNIDLDIFFGSPANGNGAPSSAFGGAAGQSGYWNRISAVTGGTMPLIQVNKSPSAARVEVGLTLGSGGGFLNPSNTGDFALLLNDAVQVGTPFQGGRANYLFSSFEPGNYRVFTYAVSPAGHFVPTPVHVPEALANQTQMVTGPMPGNAFGDLVTHSIHEVQVGLGETFSVDIVQPPGVINAMQVNGFQIMPVAETNSFVLLAVLSVVAFRAVALQSRKEIRE